MGWIGQILGMEDQIDPVAIEKEIEQMLGEGETVRTAFRLIRDLMIFTDRRLMLVDKQGITGRRREVTSIPYRSITHFQMTTTGHFDLDAEIMLYVLGIPEPIKREFQNDQSIFAVQKALANFLGR
ncbi:MAG: PH domain-containing protein [Candidatus Riflebacteria bacterium]|nr:PH domain-containing protein [Candidatus Riflebacteria bacterium]